MRERGVCECAQESWSPLRCLREGVAGDIPPEHPVSSRGEAGEGVAETGHGVCMFLCFLRTMLHKYFQKGPTVTNSCRNVPNTADGTWIFVAPSALGQQKQAGGKGSWYSEGFYFGPARWRGLNTRTPEEGLVEGLPLPPQPRRLRGASRAGCWGGRELCLQKRAPSSERKDSSRCTARCPRSHVHELRCQKYTENLFFRMALQLAHLLCELMR